tara:strand:+ start:331 stop:699 length:369 start_codon:yes stop_codon:yes gene_type:complete
MIVKFQNRFIINGFGRKRFPEGIVTDVPEKLRNLLPSTAEILDEVPEEDLSEIEDYEDTVVADLERAQANVSQEVLEEAGFAGYASEGDLFEFEDPEIWEFEGRAYKTEAAMKAAKTRHKKP